MISVLLVDDDAAVRQHLRTIIESSGDMTVVAEAWDGRAAVDQTRRLIPDLVVMDVRMPGMNGIAATVALQQLATPVPVVILTTFSHDVYVQQALNAGAVGFLLKDAPADDFLRALRDVHRGHAALDPAVTGHFIRAATRRQPCSQPDVEEAELVTSLTARQRDVLHLVARGLSNASIGVELHMAEGTVKGHVAQILAKLGAANRVEAARFAYRTGLDPLDP
ncbi:response regulator [Streptomyces sp. NPDC052040]|uniref:response regulator n=1 Tax=unclassified Streptomyces TaxID=2593676 RepID=UPI0037D35F3A